MDHLSAEGQHQAAAADPAPLEWIDGRDRTWRIEADPSGITLDCGETRFAIPAASFKTDVYVSPTGDQAVVRFAGPEDEVGFLIPQSAADELLRRIEARPPTPDQLIEQERQAAARRPGWPQMTAVSIWALICASLAFVPFVGLMFAVLAGLLLLVERGRVRHVPATLHVRRMCRISTILAVWGVAVCLLSSWTWLQPTEYLTGELIDGQGYSADQSRTGWILLIAAMLISLSVHEAAHAIAAWWCGDDCARSLGRVTLNPLAHIDPFGTILLPVLLALNGAPIFGYARPVPVRVAGIRRFRRAHILISIAGPGSNLLLAAVSLSLLFAAGCVLRFFVPFAELVQVANLFSPSVELSGFPGAQVVAVLLTGLKAMFLVNVFLAAFNLIPVPPLDGSWVLEHLFPETLGRLYAAIRPFGFLVFLALLWTDALGFLLLPAVFGLLEASFLFARCIAG